MDSRIPRVTVKRMNLSGFGNAIWLSDDFATVAVNIETYGHPIHNTSLESVSDRCVVSDTGRMM